MWAKIVWFSHNVPRWAFIEWLAFWGRLSTKDRLRSWDLLGDTTCCFCDAQVWSHLLEMNNIDRGVLAFTDEIAWACNHKAGPSLAHLVFRLSLAASVYWIWRERNFRIFQHQRKDARGLSSQIEEEVRACFVSFQGVKKTVVNSRIVQKWRVPARIFALCS
ncbi:hypothetical protein RHMOL_Rhmol11G0220700 [Rhododendron molle]|uniref:Uncharacterized protein n=1 Tax=Rhododendron molle TaxID=49168 RepID=A0ACC0LV80_RHOML|nr:hypothetical protein RHMOL_Rhmol11G0220700 [Rhododendron molle]